MSVTLGLVSVITGYYLYKAFVTPPNQVDDGKPEITKPDFT